MNKKPIFIFSNDWHIKENNLNQIKDLFTQKCYLAKELDVDTIGVLGDVLDSRIAQKQPILDAIFEILEIAKSYNLKVVMIPGNHCKTNYSSYTSFLTPFKYHPALLLIERVGMVPFNEHDIYLHFMPFFEEKMWLKEYKEYKDHVENTGVSLSSGKHILCSHIAVNGSVNNDGSKVESTIKPSLFKNFHKVFLGHYHNQSQPADNIYHLPSIQQNNFGEDNKKGFTVLNSDGSHELVKSEFKEYIKVKIDIDNKTQKEVEKLAKEYFKSDDNVRIELSGTESQLKSIKKDVLRENGIDVKTKVKEIEDNITFDEGEEIKQFDKTSLKEEFVVFCDINDLDLEKGNKYLNKKLPNE
jgi:exonuclease SbcD